MTDSSNQNNQPVVSITPPGTNSDLQIRNLVNSEVLSQVKDYTNKVLIYLCFAIGGALAASIWNLNGEIYKAVGETGGKAQEIEISRLNEEIKNLKNQIDLRDCLNDKRVNDKAGCYHVH